MIQVIERAVDIQQMLAKHSPNPISLGKIHNELKLNRGTCANIVKTLIAKGFIKKIDRNTGYIIGEEIARLLSQNHFKERLITLAEEFLNDLCSSLNENCILCVLESDDRKVLVSKISSHSLQVTTPPLKKAYESATGRMILAMFSMEEREEFVKKFGLPKQHQWNNIKNEIDLYKCLDSIKNEGFVLQSTETGFTGIAVPLFGEFGYASISVYLPDFRLNDEFKKQIINSLIKISKTISENL